MRHRSFVSPQILYRCIALTVILLAVGACAGAPKTSDTAPRLVTFEDGVASLADALLARVEKDRTGGTANAMLIPFTDADSGQVPEISRRIEAIFIETGEKHYPNISLARLTYQTIDTAHYIISGAIGLAAYPGGDGAPAGKHYRISGDVRRRAAAEIIGRETVWIAETQLNYAPTAIFRDSPLYLKGSRLTPQAPEPSPPDEKSYFDDVSLETMAIQIEGRMAYEKGDYEAARKLFAMAAERPDGQDLGTYAGLYLANEKLGRLDEAETAFRKVVAISVEKHRYLTIKYLFRVDSVEFVTDPDLRHRYNEWIRYIGEYFQGTDHCLDIVGHASRTGSASYNAQLSLDRAKAVQKKLAATFPAVYKRSTVEGRGFSQNIVGTGTDDERDELDRRVELFIVDCQ